MPSDSALHVSYLLPKVPILFRPTLNLLLLLLRPLFLYLTLRMRVVVDVSLLHTRKSNLPVYTNQSFQGRQAIAAGLIATSDKAIKYPLRIQDQATLGIDYFPRYPSLLGFLFLLASLPLHLHTMPDYSEYFKSIMANLGQKVPFLQSFSSYRPNLPNIQFQLPATSFQGKNDLPIRNPRALITFAFLLFLLFWKDIIRDVCSHVATRRLPVPVVEVSPIRNNTLGVSLLEKCMNTADG